MGYKTDHNVLKELFTAIERDGIKREYEDVEVFQLPFTSRSVKLPSTENERGEGSIPEFAKGSYDLFENNVFAYTVFSPKKSSKNADLIMLLHGLNERSFEKYLTWALRLAKKTGKSVVLFPIANHMNRSPKAWCNPREMLPWVRKRLASFKDIKQATFANLALSERLTNRPERFFLSGFQAAKDIENFICDIRAERHPVFAANCQIDFFAYSIGALLIQTMIQGQSASVLQDSRFFFFCGGSVFNRMRGISKFILDSKAYEKLLQFYNRDVDSFARRNEWFAHFFTETHIGRGFNSMISYEKLRRNSNFSFSDIKDRIMAISLKKDKVIIANEIRQTIDCPEVSMLDFPFEYSHENPFPIFNNEKDDAVETAFEDLFSRASVFFA